MKTLKDINWNQVYCFYEVSRKLSMKEAGKLLGISTPTVSEQIKKLENLLEVQLFHRYTRKIRLTNEGSMLFACAKEMFEGGKRFLDTISPQSIGGYDVKIGVQETLSSSVGIELINQYWDLFTPYGVVNTSRELMFESIIEKIIQGEYDWGVTIAPSRSNRLISKKLASSELVFCCSPQIFSKFKKKEDILRSIPFARSAWDLKLNEVLDDAFRAANIFPEEFIETDHQQLIVSLAQRGRCVGVFPSTTIDESDWGASLHTFKLDSPIKVDIYCVYNKGNEKMISIRKLNQLLKMSDKPVQMEDPEFQIKVSDVEDSLLE